MVNVHKGFTLIELIIVVAIISIVSSLAIPAYSNHIVKAKVAEVINLAGGAMTTVFENYSEIGSMPADSSDPVASAIMDALEASQYVASSQFTSTSDEAIVAVTLTGTGSAADSSVIEFVFDGTARTQTFSCAGVNTTVENQYLPVKCRK